MFITKLIPWVLVVPVLGLASARADGATPQQVDDALTKARQFLYSKEHNGNWDSPDHRNPDGRKYTLDGGQWGGFTAMSVYALLASGESPASPALAPAIAWLKKADIVGTYALAMRCQVWLLLPATPETRRLAEEDERRLEQAFNAGGQGQFLYAYEHDKKEPDLIDHSVSQYGVLAMWACEQLGIEISEQYWKDVELRWTHDQQPDGGWFYSNGPGDQNHLQEQASMTAAGVATLFLTQEFLHPRAGIECAGNYRNDHIDAGLKWMADHNSDWTPSSGSGGYLPGYTLYGIERIGVASGLKYLGAIDWYQFGADWCIKNQWKDGSWSDWTDSANIANTAFCILFLVRGRAPVLINKVSYDNAAGSSQVSDAHWNQRPRDIANFVSWMRRQTERDINWQITNLDVPEEELHDAPFLYFAGNQALKIKPEQTEKIRQFISHGGMVLFNPDCGQADSNPFIKSVIKLGSDMYPQYSFRDLPPTHPIFTAEQYPARRWKRKVTFKGLSNGVRELMIILPNDPGRAWQLQQNNGAGHEEAYQSMDDLILYGTDKQNLRTKGQSFLIKPDPSVVASSTVKIARLKYTGNWDPEPGGWDRLAAVMHNQARVDLSISTVDPATSPLDGYKVAHLTGTSTFTLAPAAEQRLKSFVTGGGTLVVDCAGNGGDFARSVESMLARLHLGDPATTLAKEDPVFQVGVPRTEIAYRQFAKNQLGHLRGPLLQAIDLNGRHAIFYSRQDLSGGLVGQPIDGIVGYDPDSSTEIMSGIILRAQADPSHAG
jgi:hypothetical protein